jgi:hypothetical protein
MIEKDILGLKLEEAEKILNSNNLDYILIHYENNNPRFPLSKQKRIIKVEKKDFYEIYVAFEQEPLV